jgi:L-lactate dehydrogenase complex protein LldE
MIRVEYPHLFADSPEWAARARRLADKTFELSEFLVKQSGWQPAQALDAPAVTYHDSCHMCRLLHLQDEPRGLLRAAGCEVNEMAEADRCCGFGGLFSLRMVPVSNAMTAEKLLQAEETGTMLLVTADPGCLMQMRGLAPEGSPRLEHLAVLLEALTR